MFYEPVKEQRYFERDRRYDSINWGDFGDIVQAWSRRIDGWYVDPVKVLLDRDLGRWQRRLLQWITGRRNPGHFAFTVMAISCLMIDTLSQYRFGKTTSNGWDFKQFVRDHLQNYAASLPANIWHYDDGHNSQGRELTDYADVLWHGYRCGILHQAHAPLYCGIVPGHSGPNFEPVDHAIYGPRAVNSISVPGTDCPVVSLCPEHLFDEVDRFLGAYVQQLVDPAPRHDTVRDHFKHKFQDNFGIDISTATL